MACGVDAGEQWKMVAFIPQAAPQAVAQAAADIGNLVAQMVFPLAGKGNPRRQPIDAADIFEQAGAAKAAVQRERHQGAAFATQQWRLAQ